MRNEIQKSGLLCDRNGANVVKISKLQIHTVISRHRKMCAGMSNRNFLLVLNEGDLLC